MISVHYYTYMHTHLLENKNAITPAMLSIYATQTYGIYYVLHFNNCSVYPFKLSKRSHLHLDLLLMGC